MKITIRIPSPLRRYTSGLDEVRVEATTVAAALEALDRAHPGICAQILDGQAVRRFVNIYLREEDIRFLDGLRSELRDGDAIAIIPAMAGG